MRILSIGAVGEDVKQLQSVLNTKIMQLLTIDGKFGLNTLSAVKTFQRQHDLIDDGIVGKNTWNALMGGFDLPDSVTPSTLRELDQKFSKGSIPWYEGAFRIMEYDSGYEPSIRNAANHALKLKADYKWGEEHTGVPWIMLLGIHLLECGNHPLGCLHNGQLIIGTGRRTTIVPKGRGPFSTFRDSIIDAVKLEGLLNSVKQDSWTIGMMLKQSEKFNGTGYLRFHPKENSPYLWARTNINDGTGKYVSDGQWSETANANTQVGLAAVFKMLESMNEYQFKFTT